MLTKFASLEVGQILEVKGSRERITGAGLDKLSSYSDYRTDDGFLYTRVRAISSRVNKNHDGWPSDELAKAYLTFIGKPIFVDHNNSDPTRARGVIVDAKLHIEDDLQKAAALDPYYASAPENHKPPTWIELLLEVDAKAYPKLAKAIINDDIDGVSMGANVERSKCSHCANIATTPEEYCEHVMNKGATYDKYDDWGRKTAAPAYEDCYDIGFFEISYVFDPADETALDLGGKRHASVEAGGKKKIKPSVKNQQNKDQADRKRNDAEQAEFNERQRRVRERATEFAQRDWDENKSFFAQPGEDYEVPAAAPEGGALGDPTPPSDGAWDTDLKFWKHPDVSPSTLSPDPQTFTTVACPECMGGVNRANCPTCEGKGQIPQEKGPLQIPEQVQPSPYRQNAEEQAAAVPEETRQQRMKQKKRVQPNRFQGKTANFDDEGICTKCGGDRRECQCDSGITPREEEMYRTPHEGHDEYVWGCPECKTQADTAGKRYDDYEHRLMNEEMGKHATMDMGGFGAAPPAGGSPAPSPQLPGAQEQNCPSCGGAMENGVCAQCTQQPDGAGAGSADPQGGMMMGSFKIARDGQVHYGEWYDDNPIEGDDTMERLLAEMQQSRDDEMAQMGLDSQRYMDRHPHDAPGAIPPHEVNMEFDTSDETPTAEVSALVDQMQGMPVAQQADLAVQMNEDLEGAVHRLMQWGMREDEAVLEANAAAHRKNRDTNNPMLQVREDSGMGYPEPVDGIRVADPDEMPADPFKISKDGAVHYAEQAPLPQSMMTTAPEDVDTLRQEKTCEVCGSDMEDGKCEVCNYEEPPEGFDNPDLAKAQEIAEMGAMEGGGGAPGGAPGEPPPGVMAPPQGGGGAPGAGAGPPGAGGGQPMSSTRKSSETPALTNERTAGKIRNNEQTILPATKTVSDHPKTTQVVKEPTRLTQSNTKATMTQIPTKAQVAAEMVRRGTFGVKTASEAEALLDEKGLGSLLAASPASDPAEHNQSVDQVGGEVDNAEGDVTHENVEKVQDIEAIPTMTWSDGKGDSLGQESPVTSEKFEGGGPIGQPVSAVTAGGFPDHEPTKVNLEGPLKEEVGEPTKTFKSDAFHVGDPVTSDDSNEVGGPIGTPLSSTRPQIVAHVLSALKIAEQMVDQGLVGEEQKFELAAQLEQESPEELAVRRDMLAKTKTAGFRTQRTAAATPKLSRIVNSSREAHAQREVEDDNIGDSALFGR